ncbi:MAG TPA: SsrA-binding protein, partial [Anaerolineaceae bacterium]
PYDPASYNNHDPLRPRQLLLKRREIRQLWDNVRQKGVTVVPVKIYLKDGRAKLDIALAKGKKLYDKRAEMAKKDSEREVERQLHGRD